MAAAIPSALVYVSVDAALLDDIGAVADEGAVATDEARGEVDEAPAGITTTCLACLDVYRRRGRSACQEEEEGVGGPHDSIFQYGFAMLSQR